MVEIKATAVMDALALGRSRLGEERFRALLAGLDGPTRSLLTKSAPVSSWFPLDTFAKYLEAVAGLERTGPETTIARTEQVIDKQLGGVYRAFAGVGSPESAMQKCAAAHATYFRGVTIERRRLAPGEAVLRYVGFDERHRPVEPLIVGFYRKLLTVVGAQGVRGEFTTPMGDEQGYAELRVTWNEPGGTEQSSR